MAQVWDRQNWIRQQPTCQVARAATPVHLNSPASPLTAFASPVLDAHFREVPTDTIQANQSCITEYLFHDIFLHITQAFIRNSSVTHTVSKHVVCTLVCDVYTTVTLKWVKHPHVCYFWSQELPDTNRKNTSFPNSYINMSMSNEVRIVYAAESTTLVPHSTFLPSSATVIHNYERNNKLGIPIYTIWPSNSSMVVQWLHGFNSQTAHF